MDHDTPWQLGCVMFQVCMLFHVMYFHVTPSCMLPKASPASSDPTPNSCSLGALKKTTGSPRWCSPKAVETTIGITNDRFHHVHCIIQYVNDVSTTYLVAWHEELSSCWRECTIDMSMQAQAPYISICIPGACTYHRFDVNVTTITRVTTQPLESLVKLMLRAHQEPRRPVSAV